MLGVHHQSVHNHRRRRRQNSIQVLWLNLVCLIFLPFFVRYIASLFSHYGRSVIRAYYSSKQLICIKAIGLTLSYDVF